MIRITAPDIFEHDAVGNFCIDLAESLRSNGSDALLYAEHFSDNLNFPIKNISSLASDTGAEDIIITNYSIYDPYLEAILSLPNRKICYFHSVTPPEFLEKFEPVTAEFCRRSYAQFNKINQFDTIIANSHYTASYLASFTGNREILVLPPVFSTRSLFAGKINKRGATQSNPINILMVNRVVPHKNIESALEIFAAIKQQKFDAILTITGECPNQDYLSFLHQRITELGMTEESVRFLGKISHQALREQYEAANALLCVSLHEGFCIPVLEAMQLGVPVFVRTGNAAEEVAEGAGVFFNDENPLLTAKRVINMLSDPERLTKHVLAGRKRAGELLSKNNPQFWLDQLGHLIQLPRQNT